MPSPAINSACAPLVQAHVHGYLQTHIVEPVHPWGALLLCPHHAGLTHTTLPFFDLIKISADQKIKTIIDPYLAQDRPRLCVRPQLNLITFLRRQHHRMVSSPSLCHTKHTRSLPLNSLLLALSHTRTLRSSSPPPEAGGSCPSIHSPPIRAEPTF